MHAEGFILFPATVIAADTPTRDFDCANFSRFFAYVTLASVGASQTVTPTLQMKLPDGTYFSLEPAAAALTAAGSFLYGINAAGANVDEFHDTTVPRICRFLLDVFNTANVTVTVQIIPAGAL